MKILIPMLGFGKAGGYRVLSRLADGLVADGHQVTFLVNRYMARPYFPTSAQIYTVDLLGRPASPSQQLPRWFNGLSNMWGLFRAIRSMATSYDAIITNHSLTVHPAVFGSRAKNKVVYYIQAYEPEYYEGLPGAKNRLYRAISLHSYKLGVAQIVNAPIYLSYKEIKAAYFVPPGYDPSHFYPGNRSPSESNRITLGCIGRHEPHKGTQFVLDAFEQLYKRDKRYYLKVAYGNLPVGWTHPNLEIVVPTNDSELGDFYRSIDIYVAAGTVQPGAYHYPVMESLACGTPVVHTGYAPGTEENSWIVPQGRSDLIANAIQQMDWQDAKKKSSRGLSDVRVCSWPYVSEIFNRLVVRSVTEK